MSITQKLVKIYGESNFIKLEGLEIYRCQKLDKHNEMYAIHYIDFSEAWLSEDLEEYFEDVLNKDYYSTEGHLQWNFYYFFISEQKTINSHEGLKRLIEKNEAYARKSILTWENFSGLREQELSIGKLDTRKLEKDLYTVWLEELRRLGLYFVYDEKNKNFKGAIQSYLNGEDRSPLEVEIDVSSDEVIDLNSIKELSLEDFRLYPEQKNFRFGQVVLGHGANASGKTSFLDSIEIILTGKCSRQDKQPDYKLSFTDDRNNRYIYPDSSSKYKARDEKWYRKYTTRGHNLNGNFNRFNYFNSDAAYELKSDENSGRGNLEEIITNVALGQEVNKLEEKIVGFRSRLEEYNKDFIKELRNLDEENKKRQEEIVAIKNKITAPNEYKNAVIETLNNHNWLIQIGIEEADFQKETSMQIGIVEDSLVKIRSLSLRVGVISKKNIFDEANRLKQYSKQIQTLKENQHELRVKLKESQSKLHVLTGKNRLLTDLERYFKSSNLGSLVGLADKIINLEKELMDLQRINSIADDLPITEQFVKTYGSLTIHQIDVQLTEKGNRFKISQTEIQKKIQELEDGISRLNQILTDIKGSGREFVKLDPQSTECPLCGTSFDNGQLIQAIEETREQITSASALQDLKLLREQNRTQISLLEMENIVVQGLKDICSISNEFSNISLDMVVERMTRISGDINYKQVEILNLGAMRSWFELEQLNEEEYLRLRSDWKAQYNEELDSSLIFQIREQLDLDINDQRWQIENILKEEETVKMDISNIYNGDIENDMTLANEIFKLDEAINLFRTLELYITVTNDKDIHDYLTELSSVQSSFNLYRNIQNESLNANNTIITLENTIRVNLGEIEKIRPVQKRAEDAWKGLDNLLDTYSKAKYLKDYINSNRREIVNIFKLIHSPKEFDDVKIEGNTLTLSSGHSIRTLDEISTGQRSALALSIFLSLNKKLQNGPNIILLDDPIAYVDDLNVLSFLDYLRELVVNSNRQVIFVTANSELAFLFKMKFDFLKNEQFTIFKFERTLDAN